MREQTTIEFNALHCGGWTFLLANLELKMLIWSHPHHQLLNCSYHQVTCGGVERQPRLFVGKTGGWAKVGAENCPFSPRFVRNPVTNSFNYSPLSMTGGLQTSTIPHFLSKWLQAKFKVFERVIFLSSRYYKEFISALTAHIHYQSFCKMFQSSSYHPDVERGVGRGWFCTSDDNRIWLRHCLLNSSHSSTDFHLWSPV